MGATMRAWHASIAGPATGRLIVVLEFESLSAYAQGMTTVQADTGWRKVYKELSGLRMAVGTSLLEEVTP